jgi:hypothetical protein
MTKKFKLRFDKICDYCDRKIRWYHKLDYMLIDADTNKIIRKNDLRLEDDEFLLNTEIAVDIFHAKCLKILVGQAHQQLTEYMSEKRYVSDEDLR